jgi:hypothetical protein
VVAAKAGGFMEFTQNILITIIQLLNPVTIMEPGGRTPAYFAFILKFCHFTIDINNFYPQLLHIIHSHPNPFQPNPNQESMKITKLLSAFAVCACSMSVLSSCGKKEVVENKSEISEEAMGQIKALGFTTVGAQKVEGGVRVEGDILLTDEVLSSKPEAKFLRVGEDEQYRTTNLVQRLPRTLTVKLVGSFPSAYVSAVDEAIRRYNAENLQLRFTRITGTTTADMPITSAYLGAGVLGQSGGFPSNGNPAPGFKLSPSEINSTNVGYIATIMAHEMGHCIGMRHTDYFNRAYSCGGSASNEGASTVGAILIPGTPSGADPNSWMLACVGNGLNRNYNTNDRTALNYLY